MPEGTGLSPLEDKKEVERILLEPLRRWVLGVNRTVFSNAEHQGLSLYSVDVILACRKNNRLQKGVGNGKD